MKRNLLSLAALFMTMLFSVSASAQTDVTSTYLKNADLKSLDGWTYEFYTDHNTGADVPVIEFYHSWSANAGAAIGNTKEFYFIQTVTIPAGEYRFPAAASSQHRQ